MASVAIKASGMMARQNSEICPKCGGLFAPARLWQRFCSRDCREDWHSQRLGIVRPLAELEIPEQRLRDAVEELVNKLNKEKGL